MSGYTKGPWYGIRNGKASRTKWGVDNPTGDSVAIPVVDAKGKTIAMVVTEDDTDTLRANAQLLASAPELLEALEAIIAACDACVKDDDKSLVDEFTQVMEDNARAAIAKAKGEQQ